MKKLTPLTLSLLLMSLVGCASPKAPVDESSSSDDTTLSDKSKTDSEQDLFHINKLNGKAVDVLGTNPLGYLNVEDDPNTDNNEIAQYLYETRSNNTNKAKSVTLSWAPESGMAKPFYVKLYTDENCTQLYQEYTVRSNALSLRNLVPQTYYYKITDSSMTKHTSEVDSFTFASHVRPIYTGAANSVANMRDLGGWKGIGGKTIKYGQLYRSAGWNNVSEECENIFVDELHIKTELDVRLDSKYAASQCPIDSINFIQNGLTDAYPNMFSHEQTIKNMEKFVTEILPNKNNYPIVYHCSSGADRTGLTSLLVESILGVSDEDIYRDYELTTYYQSDRSRADIVQNPDGYRFRADGKRSDFWSNDGSGSGFMQLFVEILQPYMTSTGKNSDAVVNFLKTNCGLTDFLIETIRSNLLE